MKKGPSIIIVAVIVIVVIAGGYAVMHKSNKPSSSTTSSSNNAAAVNNSVLATKTASNIGQYLADPTGKALYTYASDSSGVSNCTGSCLTNWPPYLDKGSTSNLPTGVSTLKRTDNGQTQYTYNGMPLYFFASDSSGQVTGNGVDNFQVAKPTATAPQSTTPSNSTPSTNSAPSTNNSTPNYNY